MDKVEVGNLQGGRGSGVVVLQEKIGVVGLVCSLRLVKLEEEEEENEEEEKEERRRRRVCSGFRSLNPKSYTLNPEP